MLAGVFSEDPIEWGSRGRGFESRRPDSPGGSRTLFRRSYAVKLRLTFGTVVAGVCFSPSARKSPASIASGNWKAPASRMTERRASDAAG